jgi:tetratricopeptide (TPR) repeat protein
MRGSVAVSDAAGRNTVVHRAERIHMPSGKIDVVSAEETDRMENLLALAEVIHTEDAAQLRIRSEPAGATVLVNGRMLGMTPLHAMVKAGDVLVSLEHPDHAPVSERVLMSAGAVQERVFLLSRVDEELLAPRDTAGIAVAASGAHPTAASLLARAQQARMNRDFRQAADLYERLIRLYPASGEAAVSTVSVGKLYLSRLGNPRVALSRFDRYLRRGGPLMQEARWGRAQSLRALGRTAEERAALQDYISRWPAAMESDAARLRLEEIRSWRATERRR